MLFRSPANAATPIFGNGQHNVGLVIDSNTAHLIALAGGLDHDTVQLLAKIGINEIDVLAPSKDAAPNPADLIASTPTLIANQAGTNNQPGNTQGQIDLDLSKDAKSTDAIDAPVNQVPPAPVQVKIIGQADPDTHDLHDHLLPHK